MENKDKPSYPFNPSQPWNDEAACGFSGLTKRESFASLALQGFMATLDPSTGHYPNFENVEYLAKLSVTAADQLLLALEATQQDGK